MSFILEKKNLLLISIFLLFNSYFLIANEREEIDTLFVCVAQSRPIPQNESPIIGRPDVPSQPQPKPMQPQPSPQPPTSPSRPQPNPQSPSHPQQRPQPAPMPPQPNPSRPQPSPSSPPFYPPAQPTPIPPQPRPPVGHRGPSYYYNPYTGVASSYFIPGYVTVYVNQPSVVVTNVVYYYDPYTGAVSEFPQNGWIEVRRDINQGMQRTQIVETPPPLPQSTNYPNNLY